MLLTFHPHVIGSRLNNPIQAGNYGSQNGLLFSNRTIKDELVQFWIQRTVPCLCQLAYVYDDPVTIKEHCANIQPIVDLGLTDDEIIVVTLENKKLGDTRNTHITLNGASITINDPPEWPYYLTFVLNENDTKIELLGRSSLLPIDCFSNPNSVLRSARKYVPLRFNRDYFIDECCSNNGSDVGLNEDRTVAERCVLSNGSKCFVSGFEPFNFAKCLAVQILSMNENIGFAFGLTNDLHSEGTHPVIVGSGCKPGDLLYFWIVNNDWLVMRKNYSQKTDLILPVSYQILWPIFELYGNTKIRMWSCLKVQEGSESSYRPAIVPISERTIRFSHRTANASSSHVNTSDVQNRTSILQKRRTSSTDASEKSVPDESAVKKVAFSNNNQKPTETEEKCVICFDAPIKAVLYKCGHACLCMQCAKGLLRSNGTGNCPICRMKILDIIPFFKA